jgi:hypothetical protein
MSSHVKQSAGKRGVYKKNYEQCDVFKALELYRKSQQTNKPLTFAQAALPHHVPETTLRDYHHRFCLNNLTSPRYSFPTTIMEQTVLSARSAGSHTLLSEELEEKLTTWITEVGERTDPPSVTPIRLKARRLYFTEQKIPVTAKNEEELMSKKWWRGFSNRHPNLTTRNITPLSLAKARQTQPEIYNHFYDLLRYNYDTYKFASASIWAMDETGVAGKLKARKGVGPKGTNTHTNTHKISQFC